MLCQHCGSPLREDSSFCSSCGATVNVPAEATSTPEVTPPPIVNIPAEATSVLEVTPPPTTAPVAIPAPAPVGDPVAVQAPIAAWTPATPLPPLEGAPTATLVPVPADDAANATDMPPEPPQKKRSKKGLLIGIIIAAVVIVGAIVAIAVVPGVLDANAYRDAIALYDSGDYAAAKTKFTELGDYGDSESYVKDSQNHLDYNDAKKLFDEGKYEEARAKFSPLATLKFSDAATQVYECDYLLAEAALAASDREGAYKRFKAISSYRDAAARAEACLVPFPGDGILYQDPGFYSSSVTLNIDAASTPWPVYLKIYSGSTHVASLFVNKGGSARIDLPAGTYTIKEAYGSQWFGEGQMFGSSGDYTVMLFDNNADVVALEDNYEYTISLYISSDGNVSNRDVDSDSF